MALANTAVLMARTGKRVLCIDWDLEAPGLDRYFRAVPRGKPGDAPSVSEPSSLGGLLTILETSKADQPAPWIDYLQTRRASDGTSIDFIGSGDNAADYSTRLGRFSWSNYFSHLDGGAIIERLRTDWKAAYDFILVDSRTGLTDSSGICTIQMPDVLVMLVGANEQNIEWSAKVARGVRAGRRDLRHDRAFLPIIPLLARFDAREESDRAAVALDRVASAFESVFSEWLPASIRARDMLAFSNLPYVPRYSFEEALAVEDEPGTGTQGLAYYYELLSRVIMSRFRGIRVILANAGIPGAALPPLLPSVDELRTELRVDAESISRYGEAIRHRAEDEPAAAIEAFELLAQVCAAAFKYDVARQLLSEAVALCESPENESRSELPRLLERMIPILLSMSDTVGALDYQQRAVDIRSRLAATEPDRAELQRDLAASYDRVGDLYGALGLLDKAREAYSNALAIAERLAQVEPDNADYQRGLSVSYNKIGDMYRVLGQGDKAREVYLDALAIRERLAETNPSRADYQRDVAVSYTKVADLYKSLGLGESALASHEKGLSIIRRLGQMDGNRPEYQRDLVVAYVKSGDMYRDLGKSEKARDAYLDSLSVAKKLISIQPYRADYQRDLSVSYNKVGDQYRALGQGVEAFSAYQNSLEIRRRLAQAEPNRVDYQRDVMVSLLNIGDQFTKIEKTESARPAYLEALEISKRLVRAEPDRTDYRRDMSISYERIGDLYRTVGDAEGALTAYTQSLVIRQHLADVEPGRVDHQRDLGVSYERLGDLLRSLGRLDEARREYQKSLDLRNHLAQAEPYRADYQRDLSVSYSKVGALYRDTGASNAAREAFQKDLDITEHLTQTEPNRADYQVDLVVSLMNIGSVNEPKGRDYLERALAILETLQAQGRLAPIDAAKIMEIRALLA